MSICSDVPYKRYDYWNDQEYYEVLDHSKMDSERLDAGLPILFNHDKDQFLARATSYSCDGKRCAVSDLIWSESPEAQMRMRDAMSGALPTTSVGYSLTDEGEQIGTKNGIPVYSFGFKPYEASLVTIPADVSVGVGRQRQKPEGEPQEILISAKKDVAILKNETKPLSTPQKAPIMDDVTPEQPKIDVSKERNEARDQERKRVKDIQELASHFLTKGLAGRKIDTRELANESIANGSTSDEFQRAVMLGNCPEVTPITDKPEIGMSKKDLSNYSFMRAMRELASGGRLTGLEKDLSDEVVAKTKQSYTSASSFFVPFDVMTHKGDGPTEQRTLVTNVFTGAGAFVQTTVGSLIELLRNKSVVMQLGARMLNGLQGNLALPTQTGAATVYWLPENGTGTASDQTTGQVTLTPHRLFAATAYSQQMLAQSTPDLESFVRDDLMTTLALARDKACLVGKGTAGEPSGIVVNTSLATTTTIGSASTMSYAEAVLFETNVANQNADLGSLGYVITPTLRGGLKATAQFTNSITPVFQNNTINGYNALATLQHTTDFAGTTLTTTTVPPLASVIFGNWADLIIGGWAGQEVVVDPYSLSMQGQVRIVVNELMDVALRHTKSFTISSK